MSYDTLCVREREMRGIKWDKEDYAEVHLCVFLRTLKMRIKRMEKMKGGKRE